MASIRPISRLCSGCLTRNRALTPVRKVKSLIVQLGIKIRKLEMEPAICFECKGQLYKYKKFIDKFNTSQDLLLNNEQPQFDQMKSLSTLSYTKTNIIDTDVDSVRYDQDLEYNELMKNDKAEGLAENNEHLKGESMSTEEVEDSSKEPLEPSAAVSEEIISVESDDDDLIICDSDTNENQIWNEQPNMMVYIDPSLVTTDENCRLPRITRVQSIMDSDFEMMVDVDDSCSMDNEQNAECNNVLEEPDESGQHEIELEDEVKAEQLSHEQDQGSSKQKKIWNRSITLALKRLCCHRYASIFQKPVTDRIAPLYSKIIKKPMDLSTIRKNIKNGTIKTTEQFVRDVMLMAVNAIMYNNSKQPIYKMAKEFCDEAKFQMDVLIQSHFENENIPQSARPKKMLTDEMGAKRLRRACSTSAARMLELTTGSACIKSRRRQTIADGSTQIQAPTRCSARRKSGVDRYVSEPIRPVRPRRKSCYPPTNRNLRKIT